jgi:hypothetical protein
MPDWPVLILVTYAATKEFDKLIAGVQIWTRFEGPGDSEANL